MPPFSVLDARQGYWQKRKRAWIDLGIQSELGRGENVMEGGNGLATPAMTHNYRKGSGLLGFSEQARDHYRTNATPGGSAMPATSLRGGKTQRGDGRGRPLARSFNSGGPGDLARNVGKPLYSAYTQGDEVSRKIADAQPQSGTSIFDPVLCELAYRWFCPPAGRVLDPFAGGSVRGIVAGLLGRAYAGVDLRPEQVAANRVQHAAICPNASVAWVVGDAIDICGHLPGSYDLLFSCPPYADLERYSDDPRDLSTMGYGRFLRKYRAIVAESCAMLAEDRFACFVVGDVRDRGTGNYRNFVGDTVAAFRDAGLALYNEAVLVTAVGSLPIRVGYQFAQYRKLGKTHQNVLVFLKGDTGRACKACGPVDTDDLVMPAYEEGGVAVCAQDVVGLVSERYVGSDGTEVPVLRMPRMEACLLADVMKGEAYTAGRSLPRVWVGVGGQWQRVEDGADLTYVASGEAYLNPTVFPGAAGPPDVPPPARRMRG